MDSSVISSVEKLGYGDRGMFDIFNREENLNHLIIASSNSLDPNFQPDRAYILFSRGSVFIWVLDVILNTKGPVSAITTNQRDLIDENYNQNEKLVIIAPSERSSKFLKKYYLN
jgi:hypothetical protein